MYEFVSFAIISPEARGSMSSRRDHAPVDGVELSSRRGAGAAIAAVRREAWRCLREAESTADRKVKRRLAVLALELALAAEALGDEGSKRPELNSCMGALEEQWARPSAIKLRFTRAS